LALLLTAIMVIGLIPAGFAEPDPVPNYGFIPNSGEASVSKVDLVSGTEVARYYTAPRVGDFVDFVGETSLVANTIPPYAWRTSRIAMDADGNAWVLNVGADAYLNTYPANPPSNFSTYKTFVAADGLVGSVVRIQADTTGLTTSDVSALTFGTDEAVDVFPVGAKGGMPRAIAISPIDGSIWIGFYGEKTFKKYAYSESEGLVYQNASFSGEFTPYEAKFDDDGVLWFSSRNANPTISALPGIWYFDTQDPEATPTRIDLGVNPYSILIDNRESGTVVWATALDGRLFKIDITVVPIVTSINISGAGGLRGLSFDKDGTIWMAGSSNNTVSWYKPSDGTNGTSAAISSGAVPVGIGMDAAGMMWAVCRNDGSATGFIAKFDPLKLTDGFTRANVGFRPYAYGDFVVPPEPPKYGFCGYKFYGDTDEVLGGWTIELSDLAGKSIATTTTDEFGKYCFSELPAGTYVVSEVLKTGYVQTFPGGVDGKHTITLPGDLENLVENGDFELGNTGFTNGYTFVNPATAKAVSPYDMGMGNEKTYTIGVDPFNYHDLWASFADHTEDDVKNLMMIVNGSDDLTSPAIWTQTISVVANSEYTFSFWGATSYPAAFALIDVYINDVLIDTFDAPETVGTWMEFSALWNSGDKTSAEIKLVCTTEVHTGNDFALDDFSMVKNFNFRNREFTKECFSETAWAFGGGAATANNSVTGNSSNAWGWTNKFEGTSQTYELWAAAGQNILSNGIKVGSVTVAFTAPDCVTVTYLVDAKYTITETHLWVGKTPLPMFLSGGKDKTWVPTSSPGLFDKAGMNIEGGILEGGKSAVFTVCGLDFENDIWVAAHAVIDWCEISVK
jgi:streptogramin lyase